MEDQRTQRRLLPRVDDRVRSWLAAGAGRVAALDASLVFAALLATFTDQVVLWFHVVFVLLTMATLFVPVGPLLRRLFTWVPLVTLIVLYAVWNGTTARSELIELPLLGSILALVVIGAQHREQALAGLQGANERLAQRAAEEREEQQHRLEGVQQLEGLARLSLGIAHDLNNVVTALLGGSEELVEHLEGRAAQQVAREILEASEQARQLMDELVGYVRHAELGLGLGESDINEVARDMEAMLHRLLGVDTELELDLRAARATVSLDKGRVGQLLVNLVVNAADAAGRGKRIRIATTEAVRAGVTGDGHGDGVVMLTVSDTGQGMPQAVLTRVFEPGFTTKAGGRHLGMGMASVQRIVEDGGGTVNIESAVGRGTIVRLEFPILPAPARLGPDDEAADPEVGGETILVVEDDRQVRQRACTILRAAGYFPISAEDAEVALERIGSGVTIELLITDISMPGQSGPELARSLRREQPHLPVLLMSGLSGGLDTHRLDPPIELLHKPFATKELLDAVTSLLHGRPAAV